MKRRVFLFLFLSFSLHLFGNPSPFQSRKKLVYSGNPVDKKILFTFDDGPHPVYTPRLLDILKKHRIRAMFFVVGKNAKKYPYLIRRMLKEGHLVGSHSYSHADLREAWEQPEWFDLEVNGTAEILAKQLGHPPLYFRPPYGAYHKKIKEYLWEKGYTIVLWNIDPLDWKLRDREKIVEYVLMNLPKKGGILLLHDIHRESVEAVPLLIQKLKEKGYSFGIPEEFVQRRQTPPREIRPLKGRGVVTATKLNFRKGPGMNFPSLKLLPKGTEVELLGEYKGWYKVKVGNQIGWVHSRYIRQGMLGQLNRLLQD